MFTISCFLSWTLKKIIFHQIYSKTIFEKVCVHCSKDMQMLMHHSFWKMCYSCDTSGKIYSSLGKKSDFTFLCLLVKFYVVTSIFLSSYFSLFSWKFHCELKKGRWLRDGSERKVTNKSVLSCDWKRTKNLPHLVKRIGFSLHSWIISHFLLGQDVKPHILSCQDLFLKIIIEMCS